MGCHAAARVEARRRSTEMTERDRNHWGWGWADRFPEAEARKAVGASAQMILGTTLERCDEPVPIDECTLPEPRIAVPDALEGVATAAREDRIRHTYGRSYLDIIRGFNGDFTPAPDFVVYAESEEHVADTLRWASEAGRRGGSLRWRDLGRAGGRGRLRRRLRGGREPRHDADESRAGGRRGSRCRRAFRRERPARRWTGSSRSTA